MTEAIWPSQPKYLQSGLSQKKLAYKYELQSPSRWSPEAGGWVLVDASAAVTRLTLARGPAPCCPVALVPGCWVAAAALALRGGEEMARLPFRGASCKLGEPSPSVSLFTLNSVIWPQLTGDHDFCFWWCGWYENWGFRCLWTKWRVECGGLQVLPARRPETEAPGRSGPTEQ